MISHAAETPERSSVNSLSYKELRKILVDSNDLTLDRRPIDATDDHLFQLVCGF
jgi:hypothetical protein